MKFWHKPKLKIIMLINNVNKFQIAAMLHYVLSCLAGLIAFISSFCCFFFFLSCIQYELLDPLVSLDIKPSKPELPLFPEASIYSELCLCSADWGSQLISIRPDKMFNKPIVARATNAIVVGGLQKTARSRVKHLGHYEKKKKQLWVSQCQRC